MRLWHYKLIPFLPDSQLVAQWRELNSIFKKQDKHILINYVYEYPKEDLYYYSLRVIKEMLNRSIKIKSYDNLNNWFGGYPHNYNDYPNIIILSTMPIPFKNHHNHRYLKQCFYNLQEKYDRGQKDFSTDRYQTLLRFVEFEILTQEEAL